MTTIEHNLAQVQQRVRQACSAAGRPSDGATLIAVSKTKPIQDIERAHRAGHPHFGENYAQELRDKALTMPDVRWHFIGRIQRNKAKILSQIAFRVHALESVAQAQALSARATRPLACLVSVNIANEATKGGVAPSQVLEMCRTLQRVDKINVVGLTAMPPLFEDPNDAAPFFAHTADLARQGIADGIGLHELSMGTTSDFHVAIAHGATWVRVGTAVFGPRGAKT